MRKFIKENWQIIGLVAGFAVDNTFDILKDSGLTDTYQNLIKGLGALIVAYYWNSPNNKKQTLKT
ncbi:MAG: hypothetical protein EAY81_11980 [Bacteroidetes bacterium]|nr:MAG: hypothetical protein EAY81_11980 [Bacteroidota bacterium]